MIFRDMFDIEGGLQATLNVFTTRDSLSISFMLLACTYL